MDAFPDELLLEVLGRIDDGLTLLDVVPLVCKRWHRLARDPGAWNSATVSIPGCPFAEDRLSYHYNHDEIRNAARVLIHAPALRRVSFKAFPSVKPSSCSFYRETTTSALDRCAADVPEIVFSQTGSALSLEDHLLPADFLSKKSSCVRYLDLGHMLRAGTPLLHALGQCESLEDLHLMLPSELEYRGELGGRRLSKVKRLTLKSMFLVEDCRAFLRDLVRCVAQSVRHVCCELPCESSKDVFAELSQCVELRSLRCGVEGVALAGTLPRLRSLSLVLQPLGRDLWLRRYQQVLYAAERALRGCGELQDLCDLCLDGSSGGDREWDPEYIQAMLTFLMTFVTKATNVKRLLARCIKSLLVSPETLLASPETLLVFMKSLPRLESVHIMDSFDTLPSLAEIEGLKSISGIVTYEIGQEDACHAALKQFKRQRPDVDCRLTFRAHFLVSR